MNSSEIKNKATKNIESIKNVPIDLSKEILKNPETGYKEFKTSKKIFDTLKTFELNVEDGIAITGLKTTIQGSKPGPNIAIIGELDGLPVPDHPFEDKTTHAAHACGHHIQIGNMLASLIALNSKEILDNLSGSITFMAVPAEEYVEIEWRNIQRKNGEFEFLGGKQEFIKLGAFDNIDISMMTHARKSLKGFAYGGTGNGLIAKFIEFHGKTSHAGGDPHLGINALNAANIAMSAIHANRETFEDENHIRIHPIITLGGAVVNQVPDLVKIETFVRGSSLDAIKDANYKVDKCLKAGALSVGAEVEITTLPGYLPIFNDTNLSNLYKENLDNFYDQDQIEKLDHGGGSTDMGDLAHIMPIIHPYVGGANDGSHHTKEFLIDDYNLPVIEAGKMMAFTVIDLLSNNAERANKIIKEHKRKLSKSEYLKLLRDISANETYNFND